MTVRRATPDDIDALIGLVERFYSLDGHKFDAATVRRALAPLLPDDSLGQVWLLEESFEVNPGEVVGLLGANGAGKTTTIRMLLGLLSPSAGTAHLLGAPPSLESRRQLGYVPQNLGLYQELTVAENVAFTARRAAPGGIRVCTPARAAGAHPGRADVRRRRPCPGSAVEHDPGAGGYRRWCARHHPPHAGGPAV